MGPHRPHGRASRLREAVARAFRPPSAAARTLLLACLALALAAAAAAAPASGLGGRRGAALWRSLGGRRSLLQDSCTCPSAEDAKKACANATQADRDELLRTSIQYCQASCV